jgi:hypothetical protein
VALHDRVLVPGEGGRVRLARAGQFKPAGVEAEIVKVTVPVKPFTAVTVIAEVPEAPARISAGATAPAAIVKSVTWKSIAAVVWDSVPLAPVTVTV